MQNVLCHAGNYMYVYVVSSVLFEGMSLHRDDEGGMEQGGGGGGGLWALDTEELATPPR